MNLLRIFPAALVAGACATTPAASSYVHIADPEQLFSAADWTPDVERAVTPAGWQDRAETIKARMNEKGGWPKNLADQSTRWLQKDRVKDYNAVEMARLTFYGQPAVLLRIPASANKHMPDGWRPTEDFFILVGEAALPAR